MVTRELADAGEPLTIDRVLFWTFCVILFVSLLEAGLHKLIHICKHHRKYYEMLHKVTGELMIVGLIYLLVKLVCYLNVIQYGGVQYSSLDAADMLLFFVALALVSQSIICFIRLRRANAKMDSLTITTAGALVDIAKAEYAQLENAAWWKKSRSIHRMRSLLEHKLLEAFFHEVYGLPMMFSFSKYLREVQDSHIVDLIEIDILGWTLLVALLAAFFSATGELQTHSLYRTAYNTSDHTSLAYDDKRKWVFGLFACSLTLVMVLTAVYLKVLNNAVIDHALHHFLVRNDEKIIDSKSSYDDHLIEALKNVDTIAKEQVEMSPAEAMEQMRTVSENIRGTLRKRRGYFKNNLMVQLAQSSFRKIMKNSDKTKPLNHVNPMLKMPLPFSRKFVQFCVRTFLIVNGLYYSMLIACIIPTLSDHQLPHLVALLIPLLLNTFWFAPLLVHKFSLLDGTWKVDPKKLSAVIDHIREVEELNDTMVQQIHAHILDNHLSLTNIRDALQEIDSNDGDVDGFIDIEALRQTLIKFGFKLSRHKFHTLVLLKYETKGTTVKFDDVLEALVPRRGTLLASHASFQS